MSTFLFYAMLVLLFCVAPGVFYIIWRYWLSVKRIAGNLVAFRLFVGDPEPRGNSEPKIYTSGPAFVPYVPFVKFDGHPVWEMVYFLTDMIPLTYESGDEEFVSKDFQVVKIQGTFFVRPPYKDPKFLLLSYRSNVPISSNSSAISSKTSPEGKELRQSLLKWLEDVLQSIMFNVFSERNYEDMIGMKNFTEISEAINKLTHEEGGVLHKSGLLGEDTSETEPGTGEVYLKIEKITFSKNLTDALEAPALQKKLAQAAKQSAIKNAEEIGGQVLGVVARLHGMTVEDLEKDLKVNPKKAGQPVAEGGYKESFAFAQDQTKRDRAGNAGELTDIRIGNSDGSSMSGELPAFAAAALLLRGGAGRGGGKQGKRGGSNNQGFNPKEKEKSKDGEDLKELDKLESEENNNQGKSR